MAARKKTRATDSKPKRWELQLSLRIVGPSLAAYRRLEGGERARCYRELRQKALAILAIDWEKGRFLSSGAAARNGGRAQERAVPEPVTEIAARSKTVNRKRNTAETFAAQADRDEPIYVDGGRRLDDPVAKQAVVEDHRKAVREESMRLANLLTETWGHLEEFVRALLAREVAQAPPWKPNGIKDAAMLRQWMGSVFGLGNPCAVGDEDCVIYYEDENGNMVCEHSHPVEGNSIVTVTSDEGCPWSGISAQVVVTSTQRFRNLREMKPTGPASPKAKTVKRKKATRKKASKRTGRR